LVDAIAHEWFRQLGEEGNYEEAELEDLMSTFFAIFYIDDTYFASQDAEFLQRALDIVVGLFEWVGLQTNTKKTQTMICTPGRIRTQLPIDSYHWMQCGRVTADEWNARPVECRQCGKVMLASSLGHHLSDVHDIYQLQVVSKDLLLSRIGDKGANWLARFQCARAFSMTAGTCTSIFRMFTRWTWW
jgi:hypothetical protein